MKKTILIFATLALCASAHEVTCVPEIITTNCDWPKPATKEQLVQTPKPKDPLLGTVTDFIDWSELECSYSKNPPEVYFEGPPSMGKDLFDAKMAIQTTPGKRLGMPVGKIYDFQYQRRTNGCLVKTVWGPDVMDEECVKRKTDKFVAEALQHIKQMADTLKVKFDCAPLEMGDDD